tara:strand:+ start:1079 stop:1375 length:297 start_codon:yes stop_codon:yes gene_type:complete
MDGFVVAAAADRSFKAGNDCAKEEEVFKPRRKTFRLLIVCVMIVMIGKRVSVRRKHRQNKNSTLFGFKRRLKKKYLFLLPSSNNTIRIKSENATNDNE